MNPIVLSEEAGAQPPLYWEGEGGQRAGMLAPRGSAVEQASCLLTRGLVRGSGCAAPAILGGEGGQRAGMLAPLGSAVEQASCLLTHGLVGGNLPGKQENDG